MGIYFNDKLLHPKEDGNEMEKRYFKEMKEINALYEKNGTIVLTRDVKRVMDSKGQSYRAAVPFALPSSVPLYLETLGAVAVRYSEGPPQRQGKNLIYPTYKNFMYERMILTEKNKDLAWFILKATTFIQGGNPGSKKVMRIYDPQKNVLDKASEVKSIAKVDVLLINEDSSVFNIKSLRTIADRFGVDIKDFDKPEAAGFIIREAVIDADNKKNPDFNIKKLLDYIAKINADKEKEVKVQEREKEKIKQEEVEIYTEERLMIMYPAQLNLISDEFGTEKVPKCKKTKQIAQILEAQAK